MIQAVIPAGEVAINEPTEIEHMFTFQEYLEYEGEPDVRYELVRGKLVPMAASTHLHTNICKFLVYKLQRYFAAQNLDLVANALGTGVRTEENTSRIKERQRAEKERQRAENERQNAETERQNADKERQRAENEHQRAEKLALRLLEMGINPED